MQPKIFNSVEMNFGLAALLAAGEKTKLDDVSKNMLTITLDLLHEVDQDFKFFLSDPVVLSSLTGSELESLKQMKDFTSRWLPVYSRWLNGGRPPLEVKEN